MFRWAFVDDQPDPSAAFADRLRSDDLEFEVSVLNPVEARKVLLGTEAKIDGALVDVDLSDMPGEHGSGPGLAQDIRVNQENGRIRSFPLVRFSFRAKVLENIGGDSSSDDLFDLKIDKEVAARNIPQFRDKLIGCSEVYGQVSENPSLGPEQLAEFLGLSPEALESWAHPEFLARAQSARSDRPHVAAGLIMRFLTQSGPLINEDLLSVRLGADPASEGWSALRESLVSVKYSGKGRDYFDLWWARGLEDWWLDCEGAETPLSSMTIEQRFEHLAAKHPKLSPLAMPPESWGTRPWRLCTLSLEEEDAAIVPVDPAFGIRMANRGNLPPWADPSYAALGVALQHRDDPRLNKTDLERHAALWKK